MEVHIEVERAAEPLHEGDRTRARRERSGATGAPALVGEDRTQRDVEAARDEHRVAGEQEPRPARAAVYVGHGARGEVGAGQ